MKYECRKACNVTLYGHFVELVDTTVHPIDCICIACVPPPQKPTPPPYDDLYLKQKANPWE